MSELELMLMVRRVRLQYEQMPGLALTIPQAADLLRLDPEAVEDAMAALVDADYLCLGQSGFVRRSERRERDRRAPVART